MLRAITEPNPPITEKEIDSFARRFTLHMPSSYRAFLLKNNGGRPDPAAFPIDGLEDNPVGVIQVFFGLNAAISTADLDYVLTEGCKDIPRKILPIACTEGYDFVCLDLRKSSTPVVFWDRRPFWGNNVWNENDLFPVAKDFETLLANLTDFVEPE